MYRTALVYLGVAGFCGLFSIVYEANSHGVLSGWMIFLFAWPLLGGTLPYFLFARFSVGKTSTPQRCEKSRNYTFDRLGQKNRARRFAPQPLPWSRHNEQARSALDLRRGPRVTQAWARLAHHGAVATATVGACLTGVFQIYGTSSGWVSLYWAAAVLLAVIAGVLGLSHRHREGGAAGPEAGTVGVADLDEVGTGIEGEVAGAVA